MDLRSERTESTVSPFTSSEKQRNRRVVEKNLADGTYKTSSVIIHLAAERKAL